MKIIRYGLVGGTAAALDFSFFALFAKWLDFDYLIVGATGFILATILNYFLSVRYVFESGVRFNVSTEFILVFLISFVGLLLHQLVLWVGIGQLGWEMLFVKILATGSVFFWNFGARTLFVFKPATHQDPARQDSY